MNHPPQSSCEPRAARWFRGLIGLYPPAFRERYSAEMLQIFSEDWSRATALGRVAQCQYWQHVIGDAVRTLPREWMTVLPLVAKLIVAGIGALIAAYTWEGAWLVLAYWLLLCAFAAALACLGRSCPPRRAVTTLGWSLALGVAGFWGTKMLAASGHTESRYVFTSIGTVLLMLVMVGELAYRHQNSPGPWPYANWSRRADGSSPYSNWRMWFQPARISGTLGTAFCCTAIMVGLMRYGDEAGYQGMTLFWLCHMVIVMARAPKLWGQLGRRRQE